VRRNTRSSSLVRVPAFQARVASPAKSATSQSSPTSSRTSSSTWKTGCRAADSGSSSSSSTRANGTSRRSSASSCASRTRPSSSRKVGSPEVSVRSGTRPPNGPATMSSSSSGSAAGMVVPMTRSSPEPSRVSSSASAACTTRYGVASLALASVHSRWCVSASSRSGTDPAGTGAPSTAAGGRGRSVGSAVSGAMPDRVSFQ
jgi:hypothetical protein